MFVLTNVTASYKACASKTLPIAIPVQFTLNSIAYNLIPQTFAAKGQLYICLNKSLFYSKSLEETLLSNEKIKFIIIWQKNKRSPVNLVVSQSFV